MSSYKDGSFNDGMRIILYRADVRGNTNNTLYQNECVVACAEELQQAVSFDYIAGYFKNYHRSNVNFRSAQCVIFDMDNTHTDEPTDWIWPGHITQTIPGVSFAVHYSRNHMKPKDGKNARPKLHVILPLSRPITKAADYSVIMHKLKSKLLFPSIDENALDAAHMFIGTENPQVEWHEGLWTIDQYLDAHPEIVPWKAPVKKEAGQQEQVVVVARDEWVKAFGKRAANIMEKYVGADSQRVQGHLIKLVGRLVAIGETKDRCMDAIRAVNATFPVPVEEKRLQSEVFPALDRGWQQVIGSLEPDDLTELGQAYILVDQYGAIIRHCAAYGWLVYDNTRWIPDDAAAIRLAQLLTDAQMKEIGRLILEWTETENAARERADDEATLHAATILKRLKKYRKHVELMRKSHAVNSVLHHASAIVRAKVEELDADPFLLNTPAGTVNLQTAVMRLHDASDKLTKCTAVSPSYEGVGEWKDFLHGVTCGDGALADYLQQIAGMILIGRVYEEKMIIAYGSGRNGKSTFFNTLALVLGDYAGMISSDALITNSRRNVQYELAELRGVLLALASELEEGRLMNTAFIKRAVSTDRIFAERKFKDPFTFTPSHTLVLFTNHLPRVGTNDTGTWRRLIVIPFRAVFEGTDDTKNYAQHLFETCGGAVLQWMIDGAKRFSDAGFKLSEPPSAVRDALAEYERANDWLTDFIEELCEVGDYQEQGGRLYDAYRHRCGRVGEYIRHKGDFKTALERRGFEFKKTMNGAMYRGLRLKSFLGLDPDSEGTD